MQEMPCFMDCGESAGQCQTQANRVALAVVCRGLAFECATGL